MKMCVVATCSEKPTITDKCSLHYHRAWAGRDLETPTFSKGRNKIVRESDGFYYCYSCLRFLPPSKNSSTQCDRCRKLKSRYNLTWDAYTTILDLQNGNCAICTNELGDGRSYVDHDHSCCPGTKSCGSCVRGILCLSCNTSLGGFKDDPDILQKAIDYLGTSFLA